MASTTKIGICNLALRALGAQRITSLDDDVESAKVISDVYDPLLEEVLRGHPWNFATERASLALLSDAPAYGYTYQYQLPSDCLKVREMSDDEVEFKIEGRKLLCDESTAAILYTKLVTDTSLYDSMFVTAFSARIQAEIAYAIVQSKTLAKEKYEEYLLKLQTAKTQDAQEGTFEPVDNQSWIDDRD